MDCEPAELDQDGLMMLDEASEVTEEMWGLLLRGAEEE